MTLRALHVHAGNLYGGVETTLVNLARHAAAAPDMESRFALCYDGRLAEGLGAAGARPDALGATRISRPWTIARARRRLRVLLAKSEIDTAVCHSTWSLAIFGPVIRAAGVPLVLWVHGKAGPSWLERWARRTAPDLVLCNSRYTAHTAPRPFPFVAAEVVYPFASDCAVARADRETLRASLGVPRDTSVVVQVSRMEPWKGHAILLDALAELKARPDWACWIVGGTQRRSEVSYQRSLRERAATLGIGARVRFLGERTDVPAILSAADVFCQPNTGPEAFGITFIEAMHQRLPVIGSRLGATPEIVDESCGVLVEPGNARALAQVLADLLDHPARRAALGANGPARAQELCDPPAHIPRLAALLGDLARKGRRAA